MFFQARVVAQMKAADRIRVLLGRIAQLAKRSDERFCKIALSQANLTFLADSVHMSARRALHKMEPEGLIEPGYLCIKLLPTLDNPENPQANTPWDPGCCIKTHASQRGISAFVWQG